MVDRQEIEARQRLRDRLLEFLHENGAIKCVPVRLQAEALGISEKEVLVIQQYLVAEGLVAHEVNGGAKLTHQGLKRAEDLLLVS